MCEPDEDVDGDRAIREARDWAGRTDPLKGALVAMDGFYSQMGGPGTVAECHALLTDDIGFPDDHVRIHEGWFQDTVPTVIAELDEIAILGLDSDFYASARGTASSSCSTGWFPEVSWSSTTTDVMKAVGKPSTNSWPPERCVISFTMPMPNVVTSRSPTRNQGKRRLHVKPVAGRGADGELGGCGRPPTPSLASEVSYGPILSAGRPARGVWMGASGYWRPRAVDLRRSG